MIEISIIVPVFNAEKFLSRCIESLVNQNHYESYEVILIDDGSTDNSGRICDEYAKKFNKIVVIHKKNEGVSKARNLGIRKAQGEYITFVDSDDFVDNNMLINFYNIIKNKKDDIIFCGHNNITVLKNKILRFKAQNITSIGLNEFLNQYFVYYYKNFLMQGPFNKIYKKKIIEDNLIEFDSNLQICEDAIFVIEVLEKCQKISSIEECYYNYMQNGTENTLLRKFNENEIEANWKLYFKFMELLVHKEIEINSVICIKEDFINRFIICLKKMVIKSGYSSPKLLGEIENYINDERCNEFKKINYRSNLLNKLIYFGIKHKLKIFVYILLNVYKFIKNIK